MVSNYIYHHGIKGMKWGIRRFQNKNGSLTPAGKKRYGEKPGGTKKTSGKKEEPSETPKKTSGKRSISEMSDDELRKQINRLNLERQYRQLLSDGAGSNNQQVNKGRRFIDDLKHRAINNIILPAAEDIGKQIVRSKLADFTNKTFKFEGDQMVFANNKKK